LHQRRRRLLEDPLVRTFIRHARASLDAHRVELILAHDRYRTRAVRIDRRLVALRVARPLRIEQMAGDTTVYFLSSCRPAEFSYYQLTENDFLLVPARELPAAGGRFVDDVGSRYSPFKNTFDALDALKTADEASKAVRVRPDAHCACEAASHLTEQLTSSENPIDSREVKKF
jgi:hypothetical protein